MKRRLNPRGHSTGHMDLGEIVRPVRAITTGTLVILLVGTMSACGSHHHGATRASSTAAHVQVSATNTPGAGSSVTGNAAGLPGSEATHLERVIGSGNTESIESILAPAIRAAFSADPGPLLPGGSQVHLDTDHMIVSGSVATVPAIVTGPEPGTWTVVLLRLGTEWMLLSARKGSP